MHIRRAGSNIARVLLLGAGLLLLAAAILGLPAGCHADPTTALNIFHTNDTWGYVDPCG